ncbi:UDP-galactose transporter [Dinochytrium kinnereticum]|nr:UDP-galactose transporter [Dinochytrium kinnereticum]
MANSSAARYLKLGVVVVGIYICFLTWGLTQERVTTTPYDGQKFKYFIFLNVIQSLIASLVAYLYLVIRKQPTGFPARTLTIQYFQLSITSVLASPFGYASLRYIDYPTMILGKSCKLIPVMVMNFLLYRKTYPLKKHLIVGLITIGVSGFMLLQPAKSGKHGSSTIPRGTLETLWGLFLLTLNLALDGVTNTTQDRIFHKFKPTGSQMMLYMNLFSSAIMASYLVASNTFTGELSGALAFSSRHPTVLFDIVLFGLCGAVGQCFIYQSLESFGSIATVTITLTRKMMSIVLSVIVYDHRLIWQQWCCVLTVFLGITLEAFWKDRKMPPVEEEVDLKMDTKAKIVKANGVKNGKDGKSATLRKRK